MIALAAAASSALLPAIVAAVGSVVSAVILALVAIRAQSAHEQLGEIRSIVEEELDDHGRAALVDERVRKALREVLGEDPRSRRWYDRDSQ